VSRERLTTTTFSVESARGEMRIIHEGGEKERRGEERSRAEERRSIGALY